MRREFCANCGAEIMNGEKFCQNCGEKVSEPLVQNVVNQNVGQKPKKSTRKIVMCIIAGIILLCTVVKVVSRIEEGTHIAKIKNSTLNAYPDMKIGDAFEDYFMDPKWEYIEDDEDGYVKFSGKCYYLDEMVRIKMHFTFTSKDAFEITYMSIDGEEEYSGPYELLEDIYYEHMD